MAFCHRRRASSQSDQPNVIVAAMKRAEDGEGIVLRLYETNGRATRVKVDFPFLEHFTAFLADGVERAVTPLNSDGRFLTIDMSAGMVATVRVQEP